MIENAAALVSQNGALVYAVCSVAPEEGPDVIRRFVLRHPEFEIDRRPPFASELGDALDDGGCVRTRPDRGGLDGFFAARLRRRS
jgi:16S rRNA (cytosine967-C5)-methyltransferase